jgi:ABC transporter DrrB family efflux protein
MPAHVRRMTVDTLTLMHRNTLRYRRMPELIMVTLIQPLIVLLLFRYVLGGEIQLEAYIQYLMPGVFGMAVINGSMTIGIALAGDITSGIVDRMRALPIARSSFFVARSLTDIAKNIVIIPLVGVLGVIVGFHLKGTFTHVLIAGALLLAFGFACAWISMTIALWAGSVEATQGIIFPVIMVASFASSGFAPIDTMPSWLQSVVKANPVTYVDDAVRTLTTTAHGPAVHNIVSSLIWIAAILVVTVPLVVVRYTRRTRR